MINRGEVLTLLQCCDHRLLELDRLLPEAPTRKRQREMRECYAAMVAEYERLADLLRLRLDATDTPGRT